MSYTEISVLRERHGQGIALPRRKGCESSGIPQMQYSTAPAQDQAGLSLSGPANMLTTSMYVDQAMEHTNPKKLQPLTIHGEKFFLKPFTTWPEPTLMTAPGWDQRAAQTIALMPPGPNLRDHKCISFPLLTISILGQLLTEPTQQPPTGQSLGHTAPTNREFTQASLLKQE